jgi:hypothetical protein
MHMRAENQNNVCSSSMYCLLHTIPECNMIKAVKYVVQNMPIKMWNPNKIKWCLEITVSFLSVRMHGLVGRAHFTRPPRHCLLGRSHSPRPGDAWKQRYLAVSSTPIKKHYSRYILIIIYIYKCTVHITVVRYACAVGVNYFSAAAVPCPWCHHAARPLPFK